jgi:hypothetical protein
MLGHAEVAVMIYRAKDEVYSLLLQEHVVESSILHPLEI